MPRHLCLLAALWLIALSAFAQTERPRIHVGYYEFHPYAYTDALGRAQGLGVAMTRRLLKQAGYEAEFRSYPGARLYSGLIDGSIHLWFGAPGKPELHGHTLAPIGDFGETALNLYYRHDTPAPRIPDDLKNARLILITGYSYWQSINDWLEDPALNITRHRTSSHASALAMLQRRRGDYLLNYENPINLELRKQGVAPLPYVEVTRVKTQLILSKRAPEARRLHQDLKRAYQDLRAAGENLRIY